MSWMTDGAAWTIDGILQDHAFEIVKVPTHISDEYSVEYLPLTICEPRCNNATEIPCTVVDCGEDSAVLRMDKLCNEQWSGTMSNCNAESDQEASSDEHVDVRTNRLKNNADDHDQAACDNTGTSSSNIGNIWSDW